jgi:predicted nuclease of restriction endonuclease-like RecB superfamily
MVRNKFEARIAKQLKRSKLPFKYEGEKISYLISGHYLPDFIVTTPTGKIYIETKGHFRPEAKRKMAAVKRIHPELDIRIIFYKYSQANEKWALKHGFKFAYESLPKEWLMGL